LASAWPRSLTHPSIDRQPELRKRPRRVKSQAKPARRSTSAFHEALAEPVKAGAVVMVAGGEALAAGG
jgi:hypothetical protein